VSLFTRRALVIGIGYMLVWEGALSFLLPASPTCRSASTRSARPAIYNLPLQESRLSADTAFILAGVLVVAALVVATWKLMRFELPGGGD
jgi:hypothetical protein